MNKDNSFNIDHINKILDAITPLLMKNGLKATSMDKIASALQMSKRTLYEIFGSKDDMFFMVLKHFHNKVAKSLKEIFENSSNIMEAILKCFLFNRDLMSNASADFIRDVEQLVSKNKHFPHSQNRHHSHNLEEVLQRGVKEGYVRNDINLKVQCRMLMLQMEALKRTEELFPEDISLLEVFDNIIIGFLRGLSSTKGIEEIDKYLHILNAQTHK